MLLMLVFMAPVSCAASDKFYADNVPPTGNPIEENTEYFEKFVDLGSATLEEKVDMAARLIPTPAQLEWQRWELTAFIHFTVNTWTGQEWGDGTENPDVFNPGELDTDQWVRTLKDAGFKLVMLTAKHHDGFCLWPTKTTSHSVASSSWKDGKGDVVQMLRESCDKYGMKLGLYVSPWDRNASCYGTPEYDDMFVAQITELLTWYGDVAEMWFDGANGSSIPGTPTHTFDWPRYMKAVKDLQTATITDHNFVTAYRLDSQEANFLFSQYNDTVTAQAAAEEAYYNVMDEVDELRFNSQEAEATLLLYGNPDDPDDPINARCEVTLRNNYNAAVERLELAEAFNQKYTVDKVVSVTYTTDAGQDTTFFINYNSYAVAIEHEGKLFVLEGESFIDAADIEAAAVNDLTYEVVTAYQPTAGQLSSYQTAQENYNVALETGDAVQISRAEAALDRAVAAMTRTTTNVVMLTDSDGTVGLFNYTTSDIVYKISDNQYAVLASQSYVID